MHLQMKTTISSCLYKNIRSYYGKEKNIFTSSSLVEIGSLFMESHDLNFKPSKYMIFNEDQRKQNYHNFLPHDLLNASGFVTSAYAVLDNVDLVGKYAYVLYKDQLVLSSCHGRLEYPLYRGDIRSLMLRNYLRTQSILEVAFSIVNTLSSNYFHFLIETLPLALAVKNEALRHHPLLANDLICIVPKVKPSFIDFWLNAVFGDNLNVHEWCSSKIKVNKFIAPSLPFHVLSNQLAPVHGTHRYFKRHLEAIRNLGFSKADSVLLTSLPKKIYIARASGAPRNIVNSVELDTLISRRGYVKVYLEDLEIPTQIALVSHASHIIAIHGAGLANLVFARDCRLVELYPLQRDPQFLHYFAQISDCFNIQHSVLLCNSDSLYNMTVNLPALDSLI